MTDEFIAKPRVAYFSMEIALRSEIPTYAGGLGVLAGDTLRSAADLELPMVAVSLASRAGYFRQRIDAAGRQCEEAAQWNPAQWARQLSAKIALPIEGRLVWIGAWLYVLQGHLGGREPVLLLDTDLAENSLEDREITHYLYGGDELYRLKQEMVLGIGGVRLLQALGFIVSAYHMNEGHSALLGVELLRRFAYAEGDLRDNELRYNVPRVRAKCRFTTHTPVEAGTDRFSYSLVERAFKSEEGGESLIDIGELKRLAGEDALNMTRLALNLSEYINGVAEKHAEVSRTLFPGYRVHAITNGVHPFTWVSPAYRALYDHYLPGWCLEPEILVRADAQIPHAALWQAHLEAKRALIERVRVWTGMTLAPELPILGFARRMTAYKRPDLLFMDKERLKSIAANRRFHIVLAGKAHPHDERGKQLIEELHQDIKDLAAQISIVFLPNYDMEMAQFLVAGADIWLNTPLPPMEASGTSGMKAAFNGVPSLSVLDGWWIEGCLEGVTGWAIAPAENSSAAAEALYDKLEKTVLPLYPKTSAQPGPWIEVMKGAIARNAGYFNSHRMMRRYATESYLR